MSSLLPPTPETIHHVLTQGGYTPSGFGGYYPVQDLDSSLTLESSQLSYNFVDSPAMGISTTRPNAVSQSMNPYSTYFPPPPPHAHLLDEPFASLIKETRNVLSSADFARVLEVCLDRATDVMFDGLENNVFKPSGSFAGEDRIDEVRIRLAGLLPGLAKWSHLALNGLPNELIDVSDFLSAVRVFTHVVSFNRGFHICERCHVFRRLYLENSKISSRRIALQCNVICYMHNARG